MIRIYDDVILRCEESYQPIDRKTHINTTKKRQIVRLAALLIKDGELLIFDVGNIVLHVVFWLAQYNNIMVMTNSLNIVNELIELDNNLVILMSWNIYRKKSASFHVTLAEMAFSYFNFDNLFIGNNSVDLTAGVVTFNELHVVNQAICRVVQQHILLINSLKLCRKSFNIFCAFSTVNILITNNGILSTTLQALHNNGIKVVVVDNEDE